MAGAAARQHSRALNLVFVCQLRTFDILMPLLIAALTPLCGRPLHCEHFLLRPDELLGIAMTLETPLHIQGCDLVSQRHEVDSPVTGRAADALVHMNAVIEINEVRKIVHFRPLDRLARPPALADRL